MMYYYASFLGIERCHQLRSSLSLNIRKFTLIHIHNSNIFRSSGENSLIFCFVFVEIIIVSCNGTTGTPTCTHSR